MSTALSCTRVSIARATIKTARCRRFASTEAVAVVPAHAPMVSTQQPQRKHSDEPLGVQMHRQLYPDLYTEQDENGNPRWNVQRVRQKPIPTKRISDKWRPMMKQNGVQPNLSARYGIPIFRPTASNIKKTCPSPLATITSSQTTLLDPTGARTRLFAKDNPECARVGDILLVRQRTGDPFAGVCIDIRRRGIDTAILLRGQLTRVGVEMWYKIYSPLVEGIEVVQRAQRRARRARLTYMRTVKHDRGSVENVVRLYVRQKQALGTTEGSRKKGAGAAAAMGGGGKKGKGKGKGRGRKR